MKNLHLVSTIILTMTCASTFAQSNDSSMPVKTGNEWQMPKDVLRRSKTFADSLRISLNLDDETTKKVFDTYLGNTKTVDEIRMGSGTDKEKKDALTANQLEFDQKLKDILSPGEFAKYQSARKAGKNRL